MNTDNQTVSQELILAHRQLAENLLYAHYSLHVTGVAEDESDDDQDAKADPGKLVTGIVVNDKNSELAPSKKLFLSTLELATFILTEYLDTDTLSDGDVACPAFSVKKGCLDFFALFECVDTLFHQWGMRAHRNEGGEGEQYRLNNATSTIGRPGGLTCLCLPRSRERNKWEVEEWAAFAIEQHLKTKWVGGEGLTSNVQIRVIQNSADCDNFLLCHRNELLHLAHPCALCVRTVLSCQDAGIPNFYLGKVLHDASEGKKFHVSSSKRNGRYWNPSALQFNEDEVDGLLALIEDAQPQEVDDDGDTEDDGDSSDDLDGEEENGDEQELHEDDDGGVDSPQESPQAPEENVEQQLVSEVGALPAPAPAAADVPALLPPSPFANKFRTISRVLLIHHAPFCSSFDNAMTASETLFHLRFAGKVHPDALSIPRSVFAEILGHLLKKATAVTEMGSVLRFARLLAVLLIERPEVDVTQYVSDLCVAADPLLALRNAISPLLKRSDAAVAPPRDAFRFPMDAPPFPQSFTSMCLSIPAPEGLRRHWHSSRLLLGAASLPLMGQPNATLRLATPVAATALPPGDASPFALLFEYGHLLTSNTEIETIAQNAVRPTEAALYTDEHHRVERLVSAAAAKALFTPRLMRTTKLFSWKSTIEAVRGMTTANESVILEGTTLDPWQADVFNLVKEGIDSALVCAPTSSGKTFLSMLAMKHCINQDPSAVVVYICPTKALANMVFEDLSESTSGGLVGIFTKENREEMLSCRILVAVPATFMILLMSVENAEFRSRLRLVVFDEVHYICDEEVGPTIEQIFLMMCCQFIAFSATFNGADAFVDWLSFVQAKQRVGMERPPIVRKIVSTLRATEQLWITYEGMQQHPWNLCDIKSIPDLAFVPDLTPSQLELTMRLLQESKLIWPLSVAYTVHQRRGGRHAEAVSFQPTSNAKWFLRSLICDWMMMSSNEQGQPDSLVRLPTRETIKFVDLTLRKLLIQLTTDESVLVEVNAHPLSRWRLTSDQVLRLLSKLFDWLGKDTPSWQQRFDVLDVVSSETTMDRHPCIVFKLNKNDCVKNAIQSGKQSVAANYRSPHHDEIEQSCRIFGNKRDEMQRCLREEEIVGLTTSLLVGVAAHHASLPHVYKSEVEKLFREGKLRVVFATSTLAVGIHTPCRWVVIDVAKNDRNLDGALMTQMAGRAGRRGIEEEGFVTIRDCRVEKIRALLRHSLPEFSKSLHFDVSFVMRSVAFLAGRRAVDGSDMSDVNAALDLDAQRVVSVMSNSISDYFGSSAIAELPTQPRNAWFVEGSIDVLRQCGALGANNEPTTYSLILQRFYYLEPRNFNLLALAKAEDASFERPEDLVRAVGFIFDFDGPRIAENESDFSMESDCSLLSIMRSFVLPRVNLTRTNVGRAVLSSFQRAASEANPNSNDWRSAAGRLVGLTHTSVPPDWIASVFVKEALTPVMELLPVLNMDARRTETGCVATCFSIIVMWPTISLGELQDIFGCQNRSAVWESFINERDETKKFFGILKEELTLLTRKGIVDPTTTPNAYRFWAGMQMSLLERKWARNDEFPQLEGDFEQRHLTLLQGASCRIYNGEQRAWNSTERSAERLWWLLSSADEIHCLVRLFQPNGCRSVHRFDPWEMDRTPAVDGVGLSSSEKTSISDLISEQDHEGIARHIKDHETVKRDREMRHFKFSPLFYNNLMLSGVLHALGLSTGVFTLPKHRVGRFIATKSLLDPEASLSVLIVPRSLGKQFDAPMKSNGFYRPAEITYYSRAGTRLLAMCPGVWNPFEFTQDPYKQSWLPIMTMLSAKGIDSACISGDALLDPEGRGYEVHRQDLWPLLRRIVDQLSKSPEDKKGAQSNKVLLVFDQHENRRFAAEELPSWVAGVVHCTPRTPTRAAMENITASLRTE